jgi:hypothetical protein
MPAALNCLSTRIPALPAPRWITIPISGSAEAGGATVEIAKGQRITGEDRDKLSDELRGKYLAGASIRALASETGRSYGFVHRLLVDSGVELRSRGGATVRKK